MYVQENVEIDITMFFSFIIFQVSFKVTRSS